MEDYGNKVSNYMQLDPRLSANLLVKLTRMNPRGGHGGANPYVASSEGCRPQGGGCHGALGLEHHQPDYGTSLTTEPSPTNHPCSPTKGPTGGGEIHSRGGVAGGKLLLTSHIVD